MKYAQLRDQLQASFFEFIWVQTENWQIGSMVLPTARGILKL
jgi:hypothetical protein